MTAKRSGVSFEPAPWIVGSVGEELRSLRSEIGSLRAVVESQRGTIRVLVGALNTVRGTFSEVDRAWGQGLDVLDDSQRARNIAGAQAICELTKPDQRAR